MSGLKTPFIVAAGAVGVLALGGVTGMPNQALADEGGGGDSSSSSSAASSSSSASSSTGSTDSTGSADSEGSADSAGASDSGGIDVSPASVAPGGVVSLHLKTSCKAGGKAKASAKVFVDAVTLSPSGDGDGWDGTAFIKSDAVEGSYSISVECNGAASSASASVTVTTGSGAGTGTGGGAGPLVPVNPVPAGGGGTAQLAAGPAAAGTSTGPLLVTGGFAAAGLAGLVIHRRRSAARG